MCRAAINALSKFSYRTEDDDNELNSKIGDLTSTLNIGDTEFIGAESNVCLLIM